MNNKPPLYDELYEYISLRGGRSFVELEKKFGKGMGGIEFNDLNLVVWYGIDGDVLNVINYGIQNETIDILPSDIFVYAIDGMIPNMPIANKIPKKGYKDPHWMPMCVYASEYTSEYVRSNNER